MLATAGIFMSIFKALKFFGRVLRLTDFNINIVTENKAPTQPPFQLHLDEQRHFILI